MSDTKIVLIYFVFSLCIITNMSEEEKAKRDVIAAVFMMTNMVMETK